MQRIVPYTQPNGTIKRYASLITLGLILVAWQLVTTLELVPVFLLPTPAAVLEKFWVVLRDGRLWHHTSVTLQAVLLGLGFGLLLGVVLGYIIAKNELVERLTSPIIVLLQSTPIVAYAPLLVIWLGSGIESKVVTAILIVFFPILMNTATGIRNVPSDLRDLMSVSRATSWQTFFKLEVPAAMPVLLTGLKTSATLAVIGAVVGEFIAANAGLGFLINLARSQYDTALIYVAVITLAFMAGALYGLVSLLQYYLLAWRRT